MSFKEQYWKYSLIIITLILGVIIFRQIAPFLGGILGAFTIYILVRNQMAYLTEKRNLKAGTAALLITTEAIFCFLIPLSLIAWLAVTEMRSINLDPQALIAPIEQVASIIHQKTGYNILGGDALSFLISLVPKVGQALMGSISSFAVNIFVLIFVLYFLLKGGKKMETYMYDVLPFNTGNSREVVHKINMIVRSNAIGIPLLALIQGSMALVGYLIFSAPNALILAFLTCFVSVIPLVGTAFVWVPAAFYMAITGNWVDAIGLGLYGFLIVAQLDNLIRFLLQKKMADIHPLITVFGVIIGLSLFGFMGIIFGPLLLSLFFLFVDMFKKEYLDKQK